MAFYQGSASRGEQLGAGWDERMAVRHDGAGDVEAECQLQGFGKQFLFRHTAHPVGIPELPPGFIPEAATCGAAVDAPMRMLRNNHRPFVDVDALGPEPCCEIICLRKE